MLWTWEATCKVGMDSKQWLLRLWGRTKGGRLREGREGSVELAMGRREIVREDEEVPIGIGIAAYATAMSKDPDVEEQGTKGKLDWQSY